MLQLNEPCGARWTIRRTCIDVPERAYHVQLMQGDSQALPSLVGFYAPSIDHARARLGIAMQGGR